MKNGVSISFICILLILVGVVIDEVPISVSELYFSLLEFINTHIKPLFFILVTYLTITLSIKKLGHDVKVYYTVKGSSYLPAQISSVILMNAKDKPVIVTELLVQFPDNQAMKLKEFDPPLILNSLSSEKVEIEQYSKLNGNYEPKFSDAVIKLKTPSNYISCTFPKFKGDQIRHLIGTSKKIFRGHVFSNKVKFAIVYKYNQKTHIAFILHIGAINNDWYFGQPLLGKELTVKETISIKELNFVDSWQLYELSHSSQLLVCVSLKQ